MKKLVHMFLVQYERVCSYVSTWKLAKVHVLLVGKEYGMFMCFWEPNEEVHSCSSAVKWNIICNITSLYYSTVELVFSPTNILARINQVARDWDFDHPFSNKILSVKPRLSSFFQSAPYSYLLLFLKCNYNFLERKSTHQLFPTVYCKRKMENVRTFRRKSETFKMKSRACQEKSNFAKEK